MTAIPLPSPGNEATRDTWGTTLNTAILTVRDAADAAAAAAASARDGRYIHTGGLTRAAVIATLDAAEALGKGTIAYFPPATYDVGNGLSLSGYSCQIRGGGAAMLNSTTPTGTVFYASTQSGPVLDFKGWLAPVEFSGKVRHCDFAVRGSGAADATKANIGIRVDYLQSTLFADIAIMGTGGPCLKITADVAGFGCYLCDFERITLRAPISAGANDVPYFHAIEANGNRFRGLGFISRLTTGDTGVSGACVVESTATYQSHDNLFDAFWFENQHVPTNGCVVSNAANMNVYRDFQFFDVKRETGATTTTHYRLLPTGTTGANFGGNEIRGVIPGDNDGGATVPHTGVDIQQSGNIVAGAKGYKGNNVLLASGVGRTSLHLKGGISGATNIGWTDSSGATTNRLIDDCAQLEVRPVSWVEATTSGPSIMSGTGTPEGARTAPVGSIYMRSDGGASTTLYVKQSGTGNTGWVAK